MSTSLDIPQQRSCPSNSEAAENEHFTLIYAQLRSLAASWWYREPIDHTLSPTALVHEVYLSLKRSPADTKRGEAYFFAAAAQAMRRVLIDHARKRARRSNRLCIQIDEYSAGQSLDISILELDEALKSLAAEHERASRVALYRVFAGMPLHQIATLLGISRRTVDFDWRFARAYLQSTLTGETCNPSQPNATSSNNC
ncbi:MAG: sigma-70 family RNA polymerase sigma factor [Phycisphaera sp.]|nr:MAG: sigma-70 family RNA polymerase sigma factor [Phycisphaera sp.]